MTKLPDAIGNLKALVFLQLRDNQLVDLPESILQLKQLQEVDYNGNKIPAKRARALARLIESNRITY